MDEKWFETSHEEHRIQQIKRFARDTTPAQRLALLEEMLRFLHAAGVDYLAAKHRRIGKDFFRTGEE
ncbi:MAG: hypothetical protein ABIV13_00890 [Fimbriimonadales bacterium]